MILREKGKAMHEPIQILAIQQLGRTHRAYLSAFETHIGLSMQRWRVLLLLHQLGELSQKELALRLPMDPGALTRLIKAIEQQGWIARRNDATDNRLTNVALTDAGCAVVNEMLPKRAAFIENAFGDLSQEQVVALTSMLKTLEHHLNADLAAALQRS